MATFITNILYNVFPFRFTFPFTVLHFSLKFDNFVFLYLLAPFFSLADTKLVHDLVQPSLGNKANLI